jgi:GTP-binding protein
LNKSDLLDPDTRDGQIAELLKRLDWQAPWFLISAELREGTRELANRVQQFFDAERQREREAAELARDPRLG